MSKMKEMTINEIHEVTLKIMKEIHEFCMKNNIQYSLAYGSMIGAVRHKGFIPWDDDIDIWMTRPNYEKFTHTFKSKHGYRHSSMYDKDSLLCFDRVYEMDETRIKMAFKPCDGDVGVFVDILPLDGVPENEKNRDKQYISFSKKVTCLLHARYWLRSIECSDGWQKVNGFCHLVYNTIKRGGYRFAHKRMLEIAKEVNLEKSKFCCYFQCGDAYRKNKQELLPTAFFNKYILIDFEDTQFMVSEEYDRILKLIYGDYMKLPPEEDRHHSHGNCYWK
jgi:lipopolysaccharide cholinephosphotransferase